MLRTALGPAIAGYLDNAQIVEVMLNPDLENAVFLQLLHLLGQDLDSLDHVGKERFGLSTKRSNSSRTHLCTRLARPDCCARGGWHTDRRVFGMRSWQSVGGISARLCRPARIDPDGLECLVGSGLL